MGTGKAETLKAALCLACLIKNKVTGVTAAERKEKHFGDEIERAGIKILYFTQIFQSIEGFEQRCGMIQLPFGKNHSAATWQIYVE